MTVTLPPELEAVIDEHLKIGRFKSPEEVLRAALRFLDAGPNRTRFSSTDELNRKIQEGLDDIERGDVIPGDLVEKEMRELSKARRAAKA